MLRLVEVAPEQDVVGHRPQLSQGLVDEVLRFCPVHSGHDRVPADDHERSGREPAVRFNAGHRESHCSRSRRLPGTRSLARPRGCPRMRSGGRPAQCRLPPVRGRPGQRPSTAQLPRPVTLPAAATRHGNRISAPRPPDPGSWTCVSDPALWEKNHLKTLPSDGFRRRRPTVRKHRTRRVRGNGQIGPKRRRRPTPHRQGAEGVATRIPNRPGTPCSRDHSGAGESGRTPHACYVDSQPARRP